VRSAEELKQIWRLNPRRIYEHRRWEVRGGGGESCITKGFIFVLIMED
jgi:hypothetical protein